MGWIEDSQVRCLKDQVSTTNYLERLDISSNKPKLVLVNISNGVTLAIEVRPTYLGSTDNGLLVYKIDSRISHGDGPIIAQKSLIYTGASITLEGFTIKALDQDKNGVLFQLIKS